MQFQQGIDRKYLRLQDLRRLESFQFSPRRILDGQYTGRHATPQRGQSVEFRDFRQYMPGDEVANVDWKVYGRTDKLYVRIYENETELKVTALVDASASMAYRGSLPDSKFDQACRIAAAIGFLVTHQQDRFGFGLSLAGLDNYQRPVASLTHLIGILNLMETAVPQGRALLARSIQQVASKVGRGEILVVLSDLWDDKSAVLKAASQVTHRGGEVIFFHLLHDDEIELPSLSNALFVDSESGQRLRLNLDDVRAKYKDKMQEHLKGWERACARADVEYQPVKTSQPYYEVLETYLSRRSAAT